ncbi:MAG: ABC transporter substrate-binding protein [Anaerolineae bacterium]|nr:ABC transporter substrate-binding protein [Anaerolineae bacterium]
MKKPVKVIGIFLALSLVLSLLVAAPLVAAEKTKITVNLWIYAPTKDTEPSEKNNFTVVNAARLVTEKFMKENPSIEVHLLKQGDFTWDNTQQAQELSSAIAAGIAPDVIFSWGQMYKDRDWYLDLKPYLDKPNPYIPGNNSWRSSFTGDLFSFSAAAANGCNYFIPLSYDPFPHSFMLFYNTDILKEAGVTYPFNDWTDIWNACEKVKKLNKDYIPFASWCAINRNDAWEERLVYSTLLLGVPGLDENGDGRVLEDETAKGVLEGKIGFDRPGVLRDIHLMRKKTASYMAKGWTQIDMAKLWADGKVAILQDFVSSLVGFKNNTAIKFNFTGQMFPPVSERDIPTKGVVKPVKWKTTKGFPPPTAPFVAVNVLKPSVQAHKNIDAVIKYLQYITAPKNLEFIVNERPLMGAPAVKGAKLSSVYKPFEKWNFWVYNECSIYIGTKMFLESQMLMTAWMQDQMADDEFWAKMQELLVAGAKEVLSKRKK